MKRIIFDEKRIGEWVCRRTGGQFDGLSTAIGLEQDGELIAGVLYDGYNGKAICMHVAGEGRGWMNREFLRICFDYPFRQLKVCKIIGLVDSTNLDARRFDEHLGFRLQCVIPDAGQVGDLCIYAMGADECRWLELKERHGIKELQA